MNWLNKLERKIGKYAIPNITIYLIIAYIVGCVAQQFGWGTSLLTIAMFNPAKILHGQIWRLLTWIFIPSSSNFILALIFMLCLFSMGRSLEMYIGTFKMNVYILGGILLNDIVGMLIYAIGLAFGYRIMVYITPYYILLTIFMALALCVPDAEVRLYFVIPIKMKWMLIFYVLILGYEIYSYFSYGWGIGILYGTQIIIAMANLGLFYLMARPGKRIPKTKSQRQFRNQFRDVKPRPGSGIGQHVCAICGRTSQTNPEMMFRYCSKCVGGREYCEDHLFTHNHVTGDFNNSGNRADSNANDNPYRSW